MSEHITSANASVFLSVEDLYPSGFQLQNFSADLALSTDDVTMAEARMGVDGRLAVDYTPTAINVTISLEANSPSRSKLENIASASRLNMKLYECDLLVSVPGINKTYNFKKGYLITGHLMPDIKKTLDPTQWKFIFEAWESSGE